MRALFEKTALHDGFETDYLTQGNYCDCSHRNDCQCSLYDEFKFEFRSCLLGGEISQIPGLFSNLKRFEDCRFLASKKTFEDVKKALPCDWPETIARIIADFRGRDVVQPALS